MTQYLSFNICLTLFTILTVHSIGTSNKLHYYATSIAIFSWLIPYPIVTSLLSEAIQYQPLILSSFTQHSAPVSVEFERYISLSSFTWYSVGAIILGLGIAKFFNHFAHYNKWKKKIKSSPCFQFSIALSDSHHFPIYYSKFVKKGVLLGFIRPIIVLSPDIINPRYVELIIAHEKQHFISKDHFRFFYLTLVDSLFWWNPLVSHLIKLNRFQIEVLCDKNASSVYGQNQYAEDFASLLYSNVTEHRDELTSQFQTTHSDGIKRLKLLKEKHTMPFKSKLAFSVLFTFAITGFSMMTLANNVDENNRENIEGALIELSANISQARNQNIAIWTEFGHTVDVSFGNSHLVKIEAIDHTDFVELNFRIHNTTGDNNTLIGAPQIQVNYGEQSMVSVNGVQESYSISTVTHKVKKPSV